MEKYKCECCGGEINPRTMVCEYCGTKYKRDDTIPFIAIERTPCIPLRAAVKIPMEAGHYMSDKEIAEYAMKALTQELAESIARVMNMRHEANPIDMTHTVYGEVRVLKNDYRF